jgi:ABC-type dipeptide/oligopeptide/nickel transport system ATPase subunit
MSDFEDSEAKRERTPILVGLVGPSGSGKTFSALRLADGFKRVTGGETFVIDTEAKRALHYADRFKFRHVVFKAPFGPLRYLEAITHCIGRGASTIVIDSTSHEHEGAGGVLEMHEKEHKRLGGQEGHKLPAWGKPKRERTRLIGAILQMPCNFIFCFRAKEKLKMVAGRAPVKLGWQPIAGSEWIYEMTLKALLLPGSDGYPTWKPAETAEREMVKIPEQFRDIFASNPQLSEDVGEKIARWGAAGAGIGSAAATPVDELVAKYIGCHDEATLTALEEARRSAWSTLNGAGKAKVKAAAEDATARVKAAIEAYEAEAGVNEQQKEVA